MTPDLLRKELIKLVDKHGRSRRSLIHLLQAIQQKYNYLSPEILAILPGITEVTPTEITSVATFYHRFRLRPAGRHSIRVCIGTACHVKGAERVYEAFRNHLNIPEGQDTDVDGLFTVEKVACLGCCMLAPAVQVDEVIYGWVEPARVDNVIHDFLASRHDHEAVDAGTPQAGSGDARLCLCSSCTASGAGAVYDELRRCAGEFNLPVRPLEVGCDGISYRSPLLRIKDRNGNQFNYASVDPDSVSAILLHHFAPQSLIKKVAAGFNRFAAKVLGDNSRVWRYRVTGKRDAEDSSYLASQVRIATEHCGMIDPCCMDLYVKHNGFAGLKKALAMPPQAVIDEINYSGLRGRGGGGYPTGKKWQTVADATGGRKYLVCNADEGDPGAFMDRMLLESFPFRILEGMMIAAHAIGAEQAFIYVREEYPLAVKRIRKAVEDCHHADYELKVEVVEGAGAFVCGEETALLAALDGRRGTPSFRPPYPSECGFDGCPTLINNVETFAVIPWIMRHESDAFAGHGTDLSRGTKTFALAGKIRRGGLIEVPIGMSLRRIIDEIGGGVPDNRRLKAVQVGGPSGGCVPASHCDLPVDYEALTETGAIMGSGGMVVLDDADCMVDIARYFLAFTALESCGKCTCCRVGTIKMLKILEGLCHGQGKAGDIERLEELAQLVQAGSICGLGRTAPNPVLSTLKFFREEYEAHLQGRCPAGKCRELITYTITDRCIGCSQCARACGAGAIAFTPWEKHVIDQEKCEKCNACVDICPEHAIKVE
ncbi:MAG: NAD(P)H-dependent oxidoreductase subunit E [Victivallaceae bacterium]|nr:NAD(P)H-dependent oxidoreductase subunit E [Victivallaceae bacterium]